MENCPSFTFFASSTRHTPGVFCGMLAQGSGVKQASFIIQGITDFIHDCWLEETGQFLYPSGA